LTADRTGERYKRGPSGLAFGSLSFPFPYTHKETNEVQEPTTKNSSDTLPTPWRSMLDIWARQREQESAENSEGGWAIRL